MIDNEICFTLNSNSLIATYPISEAKKCSCDDASSVSSSKSEYSYWNISGFQDADSGSDDEVNNSDCSGYEVSVIKEIKKVADGKDQSVDVYQPSENSARNL